MTKDTLFTLLFNGLSSDYVDIVFKLIIQHNGLAKTFDAAQLGAINEILSSSSPMNNPGIYEWFVQTNIYKKHGGGASAFINELPFAVPLNNGVERYFTSAAAQKAILGYPDCIDLYAGTGAVQGFELKNLTGRQALRELKFGNIYDIMTRPENFDYYRSQSSDCHLRSNSYFYNPDAFNYTRINRLSSRPAVLSYDFMSGIKYLHMFKK